MKSFFCIFKSPLKLNNDYSYFYFLWLLINAVTIIGIIYLFIHYTKLINKRVGTFPALVFIIAIIGFINSSSDTSISKNKIVVLNSPGSKAYSTELKNVILAENKLASIRLALHYQYDSTKTALIPLQAYTSRSGFVGGINWKPNNIYINKIKNNIYSYIVIGSYEWRILGVKYIRKLNHSKVKSPWINELYFFLKITIIKRIPHQNLFTIFKI